MTKEERLQKERERLRAMWAKEAAHSGEARFIFGIDEAGRGPLMGPVTAACCILPKDAEILYLNDSKKLSEKRREALYDEIIECASAYGIANVSEQRIDEINILNAAMEAMAEAFDQCLSLLRVRTAAELSSGDLSDGFDHMPGLSDSLVLVDGNRRVPGIRFRQVAVVHGDALCPSISAASILAKVTRDRLMREYDLKYPEYAFSKNKGYGTAQHIEAIRRYGVLPIHRRSFLRNIKISYE